MRVPKGPMGARSQSRRMERKGATLASKGASLLAFLFLCILLAPAKEATAWITLDGGENVTLHGNTNVGPPDTLEKYDLNVYGDVRVGRADSLDPFATTPGVLVEGAITASRIVLKDSGSGDAELDEASALLAAAAGEAVPDFVYVATAADVSSLGFTENHTVGFYRQEGSESDPENVALSDIFTVKLGVRDLEDGTPNKGHVDINVAGDTSKFGLRAKMGDGNSATLTFSEETEYVEGEEQLGFSYSLGTDDSKLSVGGNYSLFAFADERPQVSDLSLYFVSVTRSLVLLTDDLLLTHSIFDNVTPQDAMEIVDSHMSSYLEAPRATLNASSDGSTAFTLQAPKTRGESGFTAGEAAAKLEMIQGDTIFSLSNEPDVEDDKIVFRNSTIEDDVMVHKTFLEVSQSDIQLVPQEKFGQVVIGAEDADTESGGSDYKGATLSIGKLEILHQR